MTFAHAAESVQPPTPQSFTTTTPLSSDECAAMRAAVADPSAPCLAEQTITLPVFRADDGTFSSPSLRPSATVPNCAPTSASCGSANDYYEGPSPQTCGSNYYTYSPASINNSDVLGGKLWHARTYWYYRWTSCQSISFDNTDCSDEGGNLVYTVTIKNCGGVAIFNQGGASPYGYAESPGNFDVTYGFHGFGGNVAHYNRLSVDNLGDSEFLRG